ncbi:hypothetical protein F4802DRAFT_175775 [Xylaria palmicola]|nr:hypothetical protein F4802DRAFT_175775 [Xylaria palmicola]
MPMLHLLAQQRRTMALAAVGTMTTKTGLHVCHQQPLFSVKLPPAWLMSAVETRTLRLGRNSGTQRPRPPSHSPIPLVLCV